MKIGLLGGGQLGLMMTEAAYKLNIDVVILEKNKFCPASKICKEIIYSDFSDIDALSYLGKTCQVFTVLQAYKYFFSPVRPNFTKNMSVAIRAYAHERLRAHAHTHIRAYARTCAYARARV